MGRIFKVRLSGREIFRCKYCRTRLARADNIISTDFHLREGINAYPFHRIVNVSLGEPQIRIVDSRRYVADEIFCVKCGSFLGLKYKGQRGQNIKRGIFVIDGSKLSGPENVEQDESESEDD